MISLEQIRKLEEKVQSAVTRIRTLSDERASLLAENARLKERLESYEGRVTELQTLVSAFKADQDEIEAGIVAALEHLDQLEDAVGEPDADTEIRGSAPEHRAPDEAEAPVDPDSPGLEDPASPEAPEPEHSQEPESDDSVESDAPGPAGDEPDSDESESDEDEEPELDIF